MLFGKTLLGSLAVLLSFVGLAQAETMSWDRNTEADMKDYQVYGCEVAGCVVAKTPAMLKGTILQPAVGAKPSLALTLAGTEGNVAVTSRDLSLNESGLSVSVPFDKRAPQVPVNPTLQ